MINRLWRSDANVDEVSRSSAGDIPVRDLPAREAAEKLIESFAAVRVHRAGTKREIGLNGQSTFHTPAMPPLSDDFCAHLAEA